MSGIPAMPEPLLQASIASYTLGHLTNLHESGFNYTHMFEPSDWLLGHRLPAFQRPAVWSVAQKTRFIESAWLGLSLGIYVVNRVDSRVNGGRFHPFDRLLIDGQQRLSALRDYLDGQFPVFGARWQEVTQLERFRFEGMAFPCAVTRLKSEDALRELYDRMNFGGTPHEEHQRASAA